MTRGAELQVVAQEGKRIRTRHLEVRSVASPLGHPRVGWIVPKHGHGSVERNRLKRRLRELARLRLLPGAPALDLVIRTRREAYGASFDELAREIEQVKRQLGRAKEGGARAAPAAPPDRDTPGGPAS